jgi:hypothetical protein
MIGLSFKKVTFWIWLSALVLVSACSTGSWWKAKPISQMTPAELEERDIEFWPMWKELHGGDRL